MCLFLNLLLLLLLAYHHHHYVCVYDMCVWVWTQAAQYLPMKGKGWLWRVCSLFLSWAPDRDTTRAEPQTLLLTDWACWLSSVLPSMTLHLPGRQKPYFPFKDKALGLLKSVFSRWLPVPTVENFTSEEFGASGRASGLLPSSWEMDRIEEHKLTFIPKTVVVCVEYLETDS